MPLATQPFMLLLFVILSTTDDELINPCDMSVDDDSDFEGCDILHPKKKKSGRKSSWMPDEDIDDLVDIVINNDYYQRKLIFTNTKCQRNAEIYKEILEELEHRALSRGTELKFTAKQLRTKFKKCVSACKHAALTMKTASGIKRFQENRALGACFNALLSLVKSRDSCQSDQAIEPGSIKQLIDTESEELINSEASGDEEKLKDSKRKVEKKVFIPVKKSKNDTKKKIETAVLESVVLLKEVANNDTSMEMINFLREEMDKSREHELKLIQMLNFTGSAPHQHTFQPMSNQVTSTQYIEKGWIANYSQSPWHRAFGPNMLSQPDFPMASFDSFAQSSSMPFSPQPSPENISDGKVYHKL